MVLRHCRVVGGELAARGEAKREAARGLCGGSSLLCLALPPSHDVPGDRKEVVGGYESRRRYRGVFIDNGRLHHAFDRLHSRGLDNDILARGRSRIHAFGRSELRQLTRGWTHVDDAAQRANCVRAIDSLCTATCILHDRAGNHYYILGGARKLLDNKVDHLAKTGILVLEELRDAEEEGSRFVCRELLARVEKQGNLGQKYPAFSGLYR